MEITWFVAFLYHTFPPNIIITEHNMVITLGDDTHFLFKISSTIIQTKETHFQITIISTLSTLKLLTKKVFQNEPNTKVL